MFFDSTLTHGAKNLRFVGKQFKTKQNPTTLLKIMKELQLCVWGRSGRQRARNGTCGFFYINLTLRASLIYFAYVVCSIFPCPGPLSGVDHHLFYKSVCPFERAYGPSAGALNAENPQS